MNRLELYDYLYRQPRGTFRHPSGVVLQPYGSSSSRDPAFLEFLAGRLPASEEIKPLILDASCGRGHLAIELLKRGYEVEATEISPWLIKNVLRKQLPVVHQLAYADLGQLEPGRYDAVLSNDVLEHLESEEAVRQALLDLARLSRNYLVISVGLKRSDRYLRALLNQRNYKLRNFSDLHCVVRPYDWWRTEIERVARVVTSNVDDNNVSAFFGTEK